MTTEKQNSCAEKENCVNKNGKNERKTKAFKKEKSEKLKLHAKVD